MPTSRGGLAGRGCGRFPFHFVGFVDTLRPGFVQYLSRVLKLSAVNLLGNICGKSYGAMSLQENMLLLRHVTFPFQAK